MKEFNGRMDELRDIQVDTCVTHIVYHLQINFTSRQP